MAEAALLENTAQEDRRQYDRAVQLLREGQASAGSHLLADIARRTSNDPLRSQCLFNLGEVLYELGEVEQAYRTWYDLAHKPPARRNKTDIMARTRVLREFEKRALRLPPPDFPPRVQLEITNRCNLRCIMCTRNQMTRPTGDMALETLARAADQCADEPGCVVCLYFLGEPLLHKGLEQMAACLASVKDRTPVPLTFGIQTNGMLLTKERARSLLDAGLRSFAFSVDGLEGDLERIRPGASYPVVERNILDLLALREELGLEGVEVMISKLCDDPTADEPKRFLDRWQHKVDRVNLLGITRVEGNSYLAADGNIRPVAPKPSTAKPVYCGQGQRLLIYWNGDFGFCCGDINAQLELGNIHDRSIRDVWNSTRINAIRRQVLAADYPGLPACESCVHARA